MAVNEFSYIKERGSFELYKSNICHRLKETGDVGFIMDTLERDEIRAYYKCGWYPESFYLLAMIDYVSRINNVLICTDYDDIRRCKLKEVLYLSGVLTAAIVSGNEQPKEQARQEAIPEFMRFNIVEGGVRDAI